MAGVVEDLSTPFDDESLLGAIHPPVSSHLTHPDAAGNVPAVVGFPLVLVPSSAIVPVARPASPPRGAASSLQPPIGFPVVSDENSMMVLSPGSGKCSKCALPAPPRPS